MNAPDRTTRSVVEMGLPPQIYDHIAKILIEAGYAHVFDGEHRADLTGIMMIRDDSLCAPEPEPQPLQSISTKVDDGGLGGKITVDHDDYWLYKDPPRGSKVFLLTRGGIATTGLWMDGAFIAWHPLFKRDKVIEEQLGLSYPADSTYPYTTKG